MPSIHYITHIEFDFGAVRLAAATCERLGLLRPLVVTDRGVVAAGVAGQVLTQLAGLPVAVFDGTPSNPTEAAVLAAAEIYKSKRCDGLVAVGGGSAIDCAKGVAIAVAHDMSRGLAHYATIEGGSPRITAAVPPLVAVPTTSGTGSEVARGAIVIVQDGRKLGFHSWHLVPKAALCDPDLTLGLPPLLTAATGMDAVAHCMETFMSAAFNPPADGIALDGLERAWAHLPRAVANGADREARRQLMSASMQGAMAFQKGLGCVHSLSHSLGGVNPRLHHGTLNAVFLPAVLRFNAASPEVQSERRMSRMAHAMGLPPRASEAEAAAQVAQAVSAMNERLGLASGLEGLGVTAAQHEAVVRGALADHCHKTNPRQASAADYSALLDASM